MAKFDPKKLVPDFGIISKTQFNKPAVPGDQASLIGACISVLAIVFVFLPWWSVSFMGFSKSMNGIENWTGIFYLIFALVMLFAWVYRHVSLAFCAACGCALFSFIGLFIFPLPGATSEAISAAKAAGVSFGHTGAILSLIASLCSAVWAVLTLNKE